MLVVMLQIVILFSSQVELLSMKVLECLIPHLDTEVINTTFSHYLENHLSPTYLAGLSILLSSFWRM